MDYLMYVEYDAECLQFFLWYCDYVERWSLLPQEQKDSSPVWDPSKIVTRPSTARARSNSSSESAGRMNHILEIMEKSPRYDRSNVTSPTSATSLKNFSWPKSTFSGEYQINKAQLDGRPFQPFREEMTRIVRHYISTSGPRQLNLTHADRIACIQAVEHTTHPSALSPAFVAAETLLKGQCHPNFIRWSISNSSRPRVLFGRFLSTVLVTLGLGMNAALILSSLSRFLRLVPALFFFVGFLFYLASRHGMCVILHWNYKRNLRPWEQFADEDFTSSSPDEAPLDTRDEEKRRPSSPSSAMTKVASIDPLRKPSLQSLGGPNDLFGAEPWVGAYQQKSFWRKVFEVSITTQNTQVRAMQDRVVRRAVLWSGLISLALTAGGICGAGAGALLRGVTYLLTRVYICVCIWL
ncbi:regulator of g protein signaling superfamily protein [Apiospora sp. TS-2023a]